MPYPVIYPHSYPGIPENQEMNIQAGEKQTVKVKVNKRTHEFAYESETEDAVTIVIHPKGTNESH